MSNPFKDFPKTIPHACLNITQSEEEYWTMICISDPEGHDISLRLWHNATWEPWLTNQAVNAMKNYPNAVFLGIVEDVF